jgi:hypothetical protein
MSELYNLDKFLKEESLSDLKQRLRKADRLGREEKNEPLRVMIAQVLAYKDATKFAKMLNGLGMRYRERKGRGMQGFSIEVYG